MPREDHVTQSQGEKETIEKDLQAIQILELAEKKIFK